MRKLDRKLIYISGINAKDFLGGMLSNDVNLLNNHCHSMYTGMFSSKGRYHFDMMVIYYNNGYLIDINELQALDLIKQLMFYKLNLNVDIILLEDPVIYATLDGNLALQDDDIIIADSRLPNLGYRIISFNGVDQVYEDNVNILSHSDYNNLRYTLGILEAGEIKHGAIPFEYGFDELNAISYNKGCYLGQEFTNASKNTLHIRKRVLFAPTYNGDEFHLDDNVLNGNGDIVGSVVYSNKKYVFASIFMAEYYKAQDINQDNDKATFYIKDLALEFKKSAWISTYSLD